MKKIIFISIALLTLVYSCDKVDSPYISKIENDNSGIFIQNILIEDFTGHFCPNCPRAADVLKELHHTYGDKIIPLALHVSSLADPGGSGFEEDFRTTVGTELDAEFDISSGGLPKGMINRTAYNGDVRVTDSDWGSATAAFLGKAPSLGIKIKTLLDTINREVTINVNVHVLKDTAETLNLCVYLVEDGIINGQIDGRVPGNHIIPDYEFNHVLRGSLLNGTWGKEIANKGTVIKKENVLDAEIDKFAIDPNYNIKNLSVVVFVYDKDSKEIIQADNLEFLPKTIYNQN